jgi:hypothetical protein
MSGLSTGQGMPMALPPGYNVTVPLPQAGPIPAGIEPPKVKKPRKSRAKKPIPPATTNSSGQPSTPAGPSGLPGTGFHSETHDARSTPEIPYRCQLCNTLHVVGQCPFNRNPETDKLLEIRAGIMHPDNEDEETHKVSLSAATWTSIDSWLT